MRIGSEVPLTTGSFKSLLRMLGSLVADESVVADNPERILHRVVTCDPGAGLDLRAGDMVLAIGHRPDGAEFDELLAQAADRRCAAVACRVLDRSEHDLVAELSKRHKLCLLALPSGVRWERLQTIVESALNTADSRSAFAHGLPSSSELFALADMAATILDCPVIIDDDRMEVIAYSQADDEIDDVRRQSIVDQRPPLEIREWCEDAGVFRQLADDGGPVAVDIPGAGQRIVSAIRAGRQTLGFIWAISTSGSVEPGAMSVLTEIAERAAQVMIRAQLQSSGQPEWYARSYLLREVIRGKIDPDELVGHLDVSEIRPSRLVAFRFTDPETQGELFRTAVLSLVAFEMEVSKRRTTPLVIGDFIVVLVPDSGSAALPKEVEWADLVIARATRRFAVSIQAAVGSEISALSTLPSKFTELYRVFDAVEYTPERAVTTFDAVKSKMMLSCLDEFISTNVDLFDRRLEELSQADLLRGTEYVMTLHRYLQFGCDLTTTARSLFVHRNTLKYRMARISEMCAIDFDDPDERLVVQLQTRHYLKVMHETADSG
ncbi:hypothetical protein ABH922_002367 [Rhodococcus sp. 27YEA15]|uniref:PucR family transcriptional regulator n=1 Tax=Rhodococcus sp. 27YEA15 TaxID=3156259 RepID=UPI003C7DDC64